MGRRSEGERKRERNVGVRQLVGFLVARAVTSAKTTTRPRGSIPTWLGVSGVRCTLAVHVHPFENLNAPDWNYSITRVFRPSSPPRLTVCGLIIRSERNKNENNKNNNTPPIGRPIHVRFRSVWRTHSTNWFVRYNEPLYSTDRLNKTVSKTQKIEERPSR